MRIVALQRWAIGGAVASMLIAASLLPVMGAKAQNRDTAALLERLQRLESRTVDLEREIYRGQRPAAPVAAGARRPPAGAADLELRMMQLEQEVRRLTGLSEESEHAARQLTQRLDQLIGDVDLRLREIERLVSELRQGGPAEAKPGAVSSDATAEASRPRTPSLASRRTDPAPTAPRDSAAPRPVPAAAAATPVREPREQYRFATGLVRKSAFVEAEQAFRTFLEAYPDDRLAPNAQYWLGETLYVRQKYQDAARVFLTGYQRFPNSNKASDSLLKLGLTLSRLGQASEACATFDELLERLPKNERRLRPKAELEWRKAKCR